MSTNSIGYPEGTQASPLPHSRTSGQHFRRPQERPFSAVERETTTILMGGLTRKHDKFIEAVFHGSGYKCRALPTPDQAAFHVGKEYGNNGQCSPAYFTCGSLIQYLREMELAGMSRQEIVDRFVFFTAGSCGPCRFSTYAAEYRLSLRNAGFDGFRVIRFQQDHGVRQRTEEPGLKYTIDLGFGMLKALYVGDVLNDLTHNIRPFEVNPGETDKVMDECVRDICEHLSTFKPVEFRERAPGWLVRSLSGNKIMNNTAIVLYKLREHLKGDEFLGLLERCRKRIDGIEVDRMRVKPVVKIIGEFWAQTTEGDGNYRMFEFLEREGAHVQPEALGTWIKYLLTHARMVMHPHRGMDENYQEPLPGEWRKRVRNELRFQKQRMLLGTGELMYTGLYHKVVDRLGGMAHRLVSQYELARLADPFYDPLARGGEGYLEVGKNIYYHAHKLCHMVLSLKPFGCMPSSQSDGIQSAVINRFRDMIFLPIETSGEGEVNAHSRVQMALGEAKTKAKAEFQEALARSGKKPEELREFVARHPALRRPMYKVPHHPGVAGNAANFVLHVSDIMSGRARL